MNANKKIQILEKQIKDAAYASQKLLNKQRRKKMRRSSKFEELLEKCEGVLDDKVFDFLEAKDFDNENFMIDLVHYSSNFLRFVSDRLKNERCFMSEVLKMYPKAANLASDRLKDDLDWVRFSICREKTNIKYASDRIQNMPAWQFCTQEE